MRVLLFRRVRFLRCIFELFFSFSIIGVPSFDYESFRWSHLLSCYFSEFLCISALSVMFILYMYTFRWAIPVLPTCICFLFLYVTSYILYHTLALLADSFSSYWEFHLSAIPFFPYLIVFEIILFTDATKASLNESDF